MIRKVKGNVTTHIIFTWNPKVMKVIWRVRMQYLCI